MINLQLSPIADQLVNNMILISGTGRSGTTIIGNLIGTAKNVEYSFEPPTLIAITSAMNQCNSTKERKLLDMVFKAYCYEDLLIGSITGRFLNFNKTDDSYILNIKEEEEINKRLSGKYRKRDIERNIDNIRLAVKLPTAIMVTKGLSSTYSNMSNVITIRNPNDIINSCLEKKWFSSNIKTNSAAIFWPYYTVRDNKIHYWVKEEDSEWWINASEIERVAYYILVNWRFLSQLKKKIIIRHEDFLLNPEQCTDRLFNKLEIERSPMTAKIINTVKNFNKKEYPNLVSKLDKKIANELNELFYSF